jgi:ATP-dependent DNA helicase RecG
MYAHIREEMARGHGIYIVCPFVETSDKMEEVKAATSELERLVQEGVFEAQDCGLLHGQMPPEEKDAVLRRFKCGDIQVLVR